MRALLAGLAFAFSTSPIIAVADEQLGGEEALFEWYSSFEWQTGPAVHPVSAANATFTLKEDEAALFGEDAGRFSVEIEGVESFREVDAVIVKTSGPQADSMINMMHAAIGHVHDDDWAELDADELMRIIRASRAVQFWSRNGISEQPIEAEGVGVDGLADVADAVGAQDV